MKRFVRVSSRTLLVRLIMTDSHQLPFTPSTPTKSRARVIVGNAEFREHRVTECRILVMSSSETSNYGSAANFARSPYWRQSSNQTRINIVVLTANISFRLGECFVKWTSTFIRSVASYVASPHTTEDFDSMR